MKVRIKAPPKRELLPEKETLELVQEKAFKTPRFRPPNRPMTKDGGLLFPELPFDLTMLDDEALGKLYADFSRMAVYAKIQLAARMVETAVKRKRDKVIRAQLRARTEGRNLAEVDAKIELDKEASTSSFNLLVSEQTEVLTTAVLESYVIGRETCSREMTRRSWMRERGG